MRKTIITITNSKFSLVECCDFFPFESNLFSGGLRVVIERELESNKSSLTPYHFSYSPADHALSCLLAIIYKYQSPITRNKNPYENIGCSRNKNVRIKESCELVPLLSRIEKKSCWFLLGSNWWWQWNVGEPIWHWKKKRGCQGQPKPYSDTQSEMYRFLGHQSPNFLKLLSYNSRF